MRIIKNTVLSPYFNLAAEEYLLERESDDVFMLWRNPASVIIGKNQNTWAEVDTAFTEKMGIPVVRRLTGGGAVFHDEGNVNFTFITDARDGGIDFSPFVRPIICALAALGITAVMDGRNDIIADGKKISGNAQCTHLCRDGRRRLLHHGTLLYDADLTSLAASLTVNAEKLRSKGVRSVSSRVGNLRDIGRLSMSAEEFADYLKAYAERLYGTTATELAADETEGIARLECEKYSTWEWNFGKSPEFGSTVTDRFPWGSAVIDFTAVGGKIKSLRLTGDFFGNEPCSLIENALTGCLLERSALAEALRDVPVDKITGGTADDIIGLLTKTGE